MMVLVLKPENFCIFDSEDYNLTRNKPIGIRSLYDIFIIFLIAIFDAVLL